MFLIGDPLVVVKNGKGITEKLTGRDDRSAPVQRARLSGNGLYLRRELVQD
jgi:hypothetical protein